MICTKCSKDLPVNVEGLCVDCNRKVCNLRSVRKYQKTRKGKAATRVSLSRRRDRYHNDPEYREESRGRCREYYYSRKGRKTTQRMVARRRDRRKNDPKYSAKTREWAKLNRRRKIKEDANFRLRTRLTDRVRKALRNGEKAEGTMMLVGCSLKDARVHIENKFQKGMSWENMGEWHIDHIVPCSAFDLVDPKEQKICFNWANLQPLWATDNHKKHAKTDGQLMLL